jgi:2-polyprenyl-3-methyl-5-hydroxy-6-metoxy-1,4-benzoquinol methylase
LEIKTLPKASKSMPGDLADADVALRDAHDPLPDVVLEDVDCPLGCPRADETVLTGRDRLHNLPGEFSVVKCCTCGLLRTNPRPTAASMGFYYPDDYGPYLGTRLQAHASNSASLAKRYLGPVVRRVLDTRDQALPPVSPGRMLEVGCASGAFLHGMAAKGWNVTGIEFSASAASAARELGFPVHVGALESAPDDGSKFDLIVAWMVLEHLHDPIAGLRKLAERSLPGTWLALSTPNVAAAEFRLFKARWYALHLPNHLYHFTPETLAAVLHAGGWAIESVHHQRTIINFLASCMFWFEDHNQPRIAGLFRRMTQGGRFWNLALFPLGWLASLMGQTGRMTVWARRRA